MSLRVPSFFLLVPGPWRRPSELVDVLAAAGHVVTDLGDGPPRAGGVGVDVVEDPALGAAFSFGRMGRLPSEVIAAAAACERAALLEVAMRFDEDPRRVAAIGRTLRDAGGVAVRVETSGAASAWEPWLAQLDSGAPAQLVASAVVIVNDGDAVFTCGMHCFDLPDAQVAASCIEGPLEWLDALCTFQLAEQPVLGSGHTFAPNARAQRRKLERWPDHRHHPNDGRHNPFGLWRLLDDADPGLEALSTVPTVMPSLAALLVAAERAAARPLSRDEVERVLAKSPAVAMSLAHANALERSRGYMDIEPRRVWEQWLIVREHMRSNP